MSINRFSVFAINSGKAITSLVCNNSNVITIPVGTFVVVFIGIRGSTTVTSVTDDLGNVYKFIASAANGTTVRAEIWIAPVTVAIPIAAHTLTVNMSASTTALAVVSEAYSGFIWSGGTVLPGRTATNTGASASPTISLATTQDPNNWVVASFACQGTASSLSPSTDGNVIGTTATSGGSAATNVRGIANDNTASAPGSTVLNTPRLSASETYAAVAVELRSLPTVETYEDDSYREKNVAPEVVVI